MLRKVFVIAASLLAGCASTGPAPVPAPIRAITYETGACFGTCPVYSVTVSSDGAGRFEGRRFTGATGPQSFTVTPAQFAAFEAALAPYRPKSGEVDYSAPPLCGRMATDMPSVDVRWDEPGRAHLHYYYGCDREKYAVMADALRHAVDALPIAAFIRAP
ncbi:DUF6438 domain-containing protein [Flavisphingomonas formosensis]|uniref:DUF6438 domain-containing protein n=1 Tax=Flavisphingomonas formosensis TaxID=861534 RepID=UPI0012F87125|nr:DUF6438 domain-containing protein [Sphingomonas formosensis]